jgi:hypothetical protein
MSKKEVILGVIGGLLIAAVVIVGAFSFTVLVADLVTRGLSL